ncbi:hypothetical protein O4D10_14800 [Xanthomonas citri pv. citri]|uniref:hypothetical protein n=1 Tax=Xanthomonas citri TaxID=346 RepID=UPI0036DE955F
MLLNNAQLICEGFLQEQIRRNEAERIVPSESKVARTMLSRGLELRSVYQELEQSLGFDGVEWKVFLEFCVLATGAHWTPEKNIADRSARKRLDKVNEAIAGLADQLRNCWKKGMKSTTEGLSAATRCITLWTSSTGPANATGITSPT